MDLIDYQPRPIANTRDEDNSNSSISFTQQTTISCGRTGSAMTQYGAGSWTAKTSPKSRYYICLIERGNATLSNKLSRWCADNNAQDWTAGLDIVVYNINTTIAEGINCTPYKAVYGQGPQVFPLFSEYLQQAFPGQRVVDANDLPVDIHSSLFDDNINHNNDQLSSFSGNIDTRSRSSNNTLVNTNTAYNNSNVQDTSEASSNYQSAYDNNSYSNISNSSSSNHSSRSTSSISSSSGNYSSRSTSSISISSSNHSNRSSSSVASSISSDIQRSSDSSSDGCDDSFYYGSESVEHDTPNLYNADNNYDIEIGELNSDIYSQKSTSTSNEERHHEYNNTILSVKCKSPISKISSSSSSDSEDMPLRGPDPNRPK
ncbi:hypothetical protein INT45_007236, partial [Circinella minor]